MQKLERASVVETEFKNRNRRSSSLLLAPNKMVSSTGEGEFTSVSLAAPSRAFADFSGTLPRASSIAHWQLRDLVSCVSNPNASSSSSSASSSAFSPSRPDAYDPQLFVVRHCSTLRYSLRERKVRSYGDDDAVSEAPKTRGR